MAFGIGIDLGTTNSCVAVVSAGEAQVVEDQAGFRIQPSVLTFEMSGNVIAGVEAKKRMLADQHNSVYSFKRLLGRTLNEPETAKLVKDLYYQVIAGPGDTPVVKVVDREISLPELSAIMLGHIRDIASKSLDAPVKPAVITVPANFTDVQRAMTKVAGRIAGLDVLRILNEPTAAALAYGLGKGKTECVAIYDFGGGTFDITTVELTDDIFEVLSTSGDSYLGGDDFDELIATKIREELLENLNVDVSNDSFALGYIRTVAEDTKIRLSDELEVESLVQGVLISSGEKMVKDYVYKLDRARFEKMARPLVARSLRVCKEALELGGLDKSKIDNLVMVGGSTRMPLVRAMAGEYFGLEPRTEINPDEVVALGAALHAYALTGDQAPALPAKVKDSIPPSTEGLADLFDESPTLDSLPGALIESLPPGSPLDSMIPEIVVESIPPDFPLEDYASVVPSPVPEIPVPVPVPSPVPSTTQTQFQSPDQSAPSEDFANLFDGMDLPLGMPVELAPIDEQPVEIVIETDNSPSAVADPDEAAKQAALAALPLRQPTPRKKKPASEEMRVAAGKPALLLDVTPRALGIATAGGFCENIIERNAAIPVEQSRVFSTSRSDQTEVAINVYQGESRKAENNTKLGTVVLSGIRAALRGAIRIRVSFEINTDGILEVSARNEETKEAQRTKIELSGGLEDSQIDQLVAKYAVD